MILLLWDTTGTARRGKNYYSGQDDRQERVIDASHPPRRGFLDHTIATFNTTSSARELDILTSILIAKETTPNKSLSDDPAFAPGNPVTENFFSVSGFLVLGFTFQVSRFYLPSFSFLPYENLGILGGETSNMSQRQQFVK